MLDHVSITVTDLRRAETFYDAVFSALGVIKVGADDTWLGYGERADAANPQRTYVSIRPGLRASQTSRRHWCFKALTRAAVERFHEAALAHGGSDDGAPGVRADYHPHYFAAFVRDPDGNRVEAVCHLEVG